VGGKKERKEVYNRLLLFPELVALYLTGSSLGKLLNELYPPRIVIRRYILLDKGLNILG
jgi:hypothetical protein